MKKSSEDFLKLFFKEGEEICVSHNKYAYHSVSQDLDSEIVLVSSNEKLPPRYIKEDDINLVSLNPIKGFRNDQNVTSYRSFLVEMDDGSLAGQKKYIEEMGMPYSICVFSGSKSLHFGIVLKEDLPSMSVWTKTNKWILNVMEKADQQTLNPSRSIRFPENMRKGGKKQTLVSIGERISQEELYNWLNKFPDKKPKPETKLFEPTGLELDRDSIGAVPVKVKEKLEEGVTFDRNKTWFGLACDMAKAGIPIEETIEIFSEHFQEEHDFKLKELHSCIKSGYKKVFFKG